MKTFSLILISLIISFISFAEKEYLNKNYKLHKHEIKIALIPLFKSDKLYTQAIIENILIDSLFKVKLGDQKIISNNILNDRTLNETLRGVMVKEYSRAELKHNPNLFQFIKGDTIVNMKRLLDDSDILLIPSDIKARTVTYVNGTGNTTVFGRFRLYDLNTGELIFDYVANKKIESLIAKDDIKQLMTILLEDFHLYYWINFITKNNLNG